MSIFDLFSSRAKIESAAKVILAGETAVRQLVCYRCDRELGLDHDDERCQRKAMSRRFFLGGIAATAAGAIGVTSAIESGLFGEKSKQIAQEVQKFAKPPFIGSPDLLVDRGDLILVAGSVATIGYSPVGSDETTGRLRRGVMEKFQAPQGQIKVSHGMFVHAVFDQNNRRIPYQVVRGLKLPTQYHFRQAVGVG